MTCCGSAARAASSCLVDLLLFVQRIRTTASVQSVVCSGNDQLGTAPVYIQQLPWPLLRPPSCCATTGCTPPHQAYLLPVSPLLHAVTASPCFPCSNWDGMYVLYTYAAKRQTARNVQLLLSNPEAGSEDKILRHITLCRM